MGGSCKSWLAAGCTIRKKRSSLSRRPQPNSYTLWTRYCIFASFLEPFGTPDENKNVSDNLVTSDGLGTENKIKKLKLKVGGVTHTINTKSTLELAFSGSSSVKNFSPCSDGPEIQQKQDDISGNHVVPSIIGKGCGFQQEELSRNEYVVTIMKMQKFSTLGDLMLSKSRLDQNEGTEKEHGTLNDADCRMTDVLYLDCYRDFGSPRINMDSRKKLKSEKNYEDKVYVEEELTSDDELGIKENLKKGLLDFPVEGRKVRKQSIPTTRSRSIDYWKYVLSGSDGGVIDFSKSLISTSSKNKKGKLSEMEWQLKKTEAARFKSFQQQKVWLHVLYAVAIRKIFGQDSARKKREEKMKKRWEEYAQEKFANSPTLGSNTVRWIMGPTGTVVTFSEDIGLPSIFKTLPCSYPPPREKCAGPNYKNAYKYRDSKLKLPLCSLHCYRAIDEKMQPLGAS
ncbi:putative HIT zinc finger,PAPA-1-like conserved region [Quillaja saponaria]|uniref:HIT zinc finger,PAPA-1-like conserved region n=1 Tax=Quillaja saponaria TaxID=32244 RepID=A0AAD7LBU0_QUISA|nr:putative HIT zinc finger,PAPA-1-like conserved region [Quillaja saponaria]